LAENNLKTNFCFERHFAPQGRGERRTKSPTKSGMNRKAHGWVTAGSHGYHPPLTAFQEESQVERE
jgi:hypothetical protein